MSSAAAPPAPVLARMADYGIEVSSLGANAGDGGETLHMQCVTVCILYILYIHIYSKILRLIPQRKGQS